METLNLKLEPEAQEPAKRAPVDEKIKRLRHAIRCSETKIKDFREIREQTVKEYVGGNYSKAKDAKPIPVNLLAMAVVIYCRQLAARAPRVMCTPKTGGKQLVLKAEMLEMAINQLIEKIEFEDTLKQVVLNAIFGMGILKIGLESAGEVQFDGHTHQVGQVFADNIDLDDFVWDTKAQRFLDCAFFGHKYRKPKDWVRNAEMFDPVARNTIVDSQARFAPVDQNLTANISGEKKANDTPDDYEECVELMDVYLPREQRIITLAAQEDVPPLMDRPWEGPESGPYLFLTFQDVPNNCYPLPPASLWVDMHDLANRIFVKLGDDAERQKKIGLVKKSPDGTADAEAIGNANNGCLVGVHDPNNVQEASYGGIDQTSLAFFLQVRQLFSTMGGNLDVLGGLGAQADTARQEELIANSASQQVQEMRDRTVKIAKKSARIFGLYLWEDPLIEIPLTKRIPGTSIEIPVVWTPEMRQGDFLDYNIDIQPYSMVDQTPAAKIQAIRMVVQEFILPLMPLMQQSGMTLSVEGLLRLLSKYMSLPELEQLIEFAMPMQMLGNDVVQPPSGKPAFTKRTYERVNRPGATPRGNDQILTNVLLGGNPQESEMAALGRVAS